MKKISTGGSNDLAPVVVCLPVLDSCCRVHDNRTGKEYVQRNMFSWDKIDFQEKVEFLYLLM